MIGAQRLPLSGTPVTGRREHGTRLTVSSGFSTQRIAGPALKPVCNAGKVVAFTEVSDTKDFPPADVSYTRPATEEDYCKASIKVQMPFLSLMEIWVAEVFELPLLKR